MTIFERVAGALGFVRAETVPAGIVPPSRSAGNTATVEASVGLIPVYRNIQILGTAARQITLDQKRTYGRTVPSETAHPLIKKPCLDMSRGDFIEQTVMAMAATGNAYWRIIRAGAAGTDAVLNVELLNPHEVTKTTNPATGGTAYSWRGKTLQAHEVKHLPLFTLPGATYGLGPIQAARVDVAGALDLRDYAGNWFNGAGQPDGVLTTDQAVTATDAAQIREGWENPAAAVPGRRGIRVLGKGAHYSPIYLKPADAQFLESQSFSVTQLARLFGIPSSLALAAVEGKSGTYQNVSQEWLAFYRFTLMAYLGKIEDALTDLLPNGSVARFNVESLLRMDTRSRYEGHEIAIRSGWRVPSEIRAIEDLDPFTAEQLAEAAAVTKPAPAKQESPA